MLQYLVDGIVITSAAVASDVARICAQREAPVVLLNRNVPGLDISAVCCDNVEGGRQVARHLVSLGHERFAFVAGQPDASTSLERQQGFISELAKFGISSRIVEQAGDYSYEAGYEAARRIAREGHPPDAVFFASDILAIGGMDALRQSFSIPRDISVAGFNDVPLAAWPTCALTTLRHPWEAMADQVIALMSLDPGAPAAPRPCTHLIAGELVVRASTGPRNAGASPVIPERAARGRR